MGLRPLSIDQQTTGMNRELKIPGMKPKVRLKDPAVFAPQFATMINSGLSLLRSLSILTEQTGEQGAGPDPRERSATTSRPGNSMSASMAKHPDVFPPLLVNMCRAGEVGGFLDMVLLQLAENYEAEVRLRGKVKAAMTYPVVVFIIAILAVIGMLLFIVPVFVGLFADFDSALPAPTRFLVFLSGLMKFLAPLGVVGLIVFSVVWPKVKRKDGVRNVLDPLKLKLPVFGLLFQKIALARFARNLGTMMKSGVPILQSLDIVSATTGNVVLERALKDVQDSVRQASAALPHWRTTRCSRRWSCR
jgi:type IV pilus assembly protein PilC